MVHLQVNERTESAKRANNILFNIHAFSVVCTSLDLLLSQNCYFRFHDFQNTFNVASV